MTILRTNSLLVVDSVKLTTNERSATSRLLPKGQSFYRVLCWTYTRMNSKPS